MEDELAQWERCHAPAASAPRGAICSAELSSCRAWPTTAAGSVATTVRMYTLPRKHTHKTGSLVQGGLHMCRRGQSRPHIYVVVWCCDQAVPSRLFTDEDTATTIKGLGFRDAATARETIRLSGQPGCEYKQ